MPMIESVEVTRKLLPIIFIGDVSGGMSGDRIATVNETMHESLCLLQEVSEYYSEVDIRIGVLKFSSGAQWVTHSGLVPLSDFYWNYLQAGGVSDFGAALKKLNEKMSRMEFLASDVGYMRPIYVFILGGEPTDDWENALDNILSSNRWFKEGLRVCVKVDAEVGDKTCEKIAGNKEAIIGLEELPEVLRIMVGRRVFPIGQRCPDFDEVSSSKDANPPRNNEDKPVNDRALDRSNENKTVNADKEYSLVLPSGLVTLKKDEKYVVTQCQFQVTSQEEALKPCFEIQWESAINDWCVRNIGFKDSFHLRPIRPGENNLIRGLDDFRLHIQGAIHRELCSSVYSDR